MPACNGCNRNTTSVIIRHVGSTLLAEYQYRVVTIPGRTNPADFLTRKRFPDDPGPAPHTGYDEPDSSLELFTVPGAPPASAFVFAGPEAESRRFLHADFAAAVRAALAV